MESEHLKGQLHKMCIRDRLRYVTHFYMDFNWQNVYVGVLEAEEAGVHYYFIDNESYFGGFKPYGDDPRYEIEKYAYFCKACLLYTSWKVRQEKIPCQGKRADG